MRSKAIKFDTSAFFRQPCGNQTHMARPMRRRFLPMGARASLAGGNLSLGRRTPLPRHAVRQMDTRAAHRAVGVALLSGQAAVSFYISMTIPMPMQPPQTASSRDVEVSQTPRLHRGQGHKPFIARVSCRKWPVLPSRGMMQGDSVAIDISQLQA